MNETAASETRGSRVQMVVSYMMLLVGISLVAAGAVAAFVSSNSSGSAALIAVGAASLLAIVFRDRIQEAKIGGFEFKLAVDVKDYLRTAFDLKVRGNYEGSEKELGHAFERFVEALDSREYRRYRISQKYQVDVQGMLKQIVPEQFSGDVENSSGTDSFYPLVDAVLRLDGARVHNKLTEQKHELCPELEQHLEQRLCVGVTIRPGPELEPKKLVERLRINVGNGALHANCFLLIQNCWEEEPGKSFRELAWVQGMHATSVRFLAEGTVGQLNDAITKAILTICDDHLPPRVRTDGIAPGVPDRSAVPEKRSGA